MTITVAALVDSLLTHFDQSDVIYSLNIDGIKHPYDPTLEPKGVGVPIDRQLSTGKDYPPSYSGGNGYAPYATIRKGS